MSYLYRYLQSIFTLLGIFGSAYMIVDSVRGSTVGQYAIYISIVSSLGVPFFYYLIEDRNLALQGNRCVHGVHGTDCYDCYVTYVEERKL